MSKASAYARISLTLPPEVLAEADRLSAELDRSRSWVIAEAIRQFARGGENNPPASSDSRLAQLPTEMALSPEERVVAGEHMAVPTTGQAHGGRDQFLSFRSYHGYLRWDSRPGRRP